MVGLKRSLKNQEDSKHPETAERKLYRQKVCWPVFGMGNGIQITETVI